MKFVCCATGRTFRDIARVEGSKSQDRKIKLITKLLVASKGMEPGYIMRALQVCPSAGFGDHMMSGCSWGWAT